MRRATRTRCATALAVGLALAGPAMAQHANDDSPDAERTDPGALDRTRGLVGERWIVEDIDRGGVIDGTRASLRFAPGGTLSGLATCNGMVGGYTLGDGATPTGGGLTFERLGTTRKRCAPALMTQEAMLLAALDAVTRYEIDDTGALLLHSDDGRVIVARRR